MTQLEKMLRNDLDRLSDNESKLKFLRKETHNANPESCWGRFVINTCNRLTMEINTKST